MSRSNGIIYADSLIDFSIQNISLTSKLNFQSNQGGLLTLTNITSIHIINTTSLIYPSCQFKSLYGGLFFIHNANSVNMTQFNFNLLFFDSQVQNFGIQGGILYIGSEQYSKVYLNQIKAIGLNSQADGGFAYLDCQIAYLKDVSISQFISLKNGGAIFTESKLSLENVSLIENESYFTAGAVFGGTIIKAVNVLVRENVSLFGGGFYSTQGIEDNINGIVFDKNKAAIQGNNTCKGIDRIKITQFSEFNQYFDYPYKIINYTYQYDQERENILYVNQIYNGLTYFIILQFSVDGEWINKLDPQIVNENLNDLTPQIFGMDIFSSQQIQTINSIPLEANQFFFSFSILQDNSQSQLQGAYFLYNHTKKFQNSFGIFSNISSNCTNGMIQSSFKGQTFCQYCVDSIVNNTQSQKIPTKCLPCPKDYFKRCYADYSDLKEGFWRENSTVDSNQIFPCSIRQQNCIGGNSTGDNLCSVGHIGVECLECDLSNQRGDGSYSRTNIYSCTRCDAIKYNIVKIIFLLIIVFIAILIIFTTNFRQQRNFVYKKYLSEMKILYFGKSYYRLGQSGSYIRILSFYLQIINISSYFYGSYTWKSIFSFQQQFYNPVVNSVFSFDCFLVQDTRENDTIMYKKIIIITIAPFIIVFISLIPSLLKFIFRKSKFKSLQYSASLVISYGFTSLFCIPVIDVLVSGMLCRKFSSGNSFSILDFNIECSDPNRLAFLFSFIGPFLAVYSIGIPGVLFYFLYKNRNNLDKISCRFLLGFLYIDYKQEFYYWEYVRLFVKFLLILSLYSFLSSTQLIGYATLAVLILYLIILVKKKPYVTHKLNEMEIKSIVIGCLFLIAYMINFELEQQQLALYEKHSSSSQYEIFQTAVIITANILSLLYLTYMIFSITISILQPHLYKLQNYKCYQFIVRYLKILRFKKYTERKLKNLKRFRKLVQKIAKDSYITEAMSENTEQISIHDEFNQLSQTQQELQQQEIILNQ